MTDKTDKPGKTQYKARKPISPLHEVGLKPCRECGAPLFNSSPSRRAQGSYWHPDIPLSPREAVNLREALKCVRNTGDWWGQLYYRCEQVLEVYGDGTERPARNAAQMLKTPQEIPDDLDAATARKALKAQEGSRA